jgi:hypothetical protein
MFSPPWMGLKAKKEKRKKVFQIVVERSFSYWCKEINCHGYCGQGM